MGKYELRFLFRNMLYGIMDELKKYKMEGSHINTPSVLDGLSCSKYILGYWYVFQTMVCYLFIIGSKTLAINFECVDSI